ncbi:MAG: hypothetical protein RBJ76_22345 [Stenomitos frigidus ULC029]
MNRSSACPDQTIEFDGIIHRWDGVLLLELEPKDTTENQIFLLAIIRSKNRSPAFKKHRPYSICAGLW